MSISRTAFLLAVVASACLATPGFADDLATTVAGQLRDSGALSGYRVNVKSKSGTVWLEGRVADQQQLAAAVGIAEATPGVERVVNRLVIDAGRPTAGTSGGFGMPASAWGLAGMQPPASRPEPATIAPPPASSPITNPLAAVSGLFFAGGNRSEPAGQVQLTQATQPVGRVNRAATAAARPIPQPRQAGGQRTAMRTSGTMGGPMTLPAPGGYDGPLVDGQMVPGTMQYSEGYGPGPAAGGYGGGPGMGGPMPMGGAGVGMPPVPMRGDGPNMPNYAWPSYAAYPNYAGLQYPTQYSPTAWPYIGPFYPYPQVPLGWRRVSLEWDDGWWWLDFDDRHHHSHHR
jgi:hypothetical protein